MSAVDRVFGVTELAEGILKHLPIYDLVIATTISKHWEQIICNSAQIHAQLAVASFPTRVYGQPGNPASLETCNREGGRSWPSLPWALKIRVQNGNVLVLKTCAFTSAGHIQIFVPNDKQKPLVVLDGEKTRGAWAENYNLRSLWMYFFPKHSNEPVAWKRENVLLAPKPGTVNNENWREDRLDTKYLDNFHRADVQTYQRNYLAACKKNRRELPFWHGEGVYGAELDMACEGLDAMAPRIETYRHGERIRNRLHEWQDDDYYRFY